MYIKKIGNFFGVSFGEPLVQGIPKLGVLFCIKDLATYNLVHYFGLVHSAIVLHSSNFAHSTIYKVNGHGVVDGVGDGVGG
jgi:hypothetical protein